jgi:hypothetical protein
MVSRLDWGRKMPDRKAGKPVPKPVNLKEQVLRRLRGTRYCGVRPLTLTAVIRHVMEEDSQWRVKVKTTVTSDHTQWKMEIEAALQEAAARPVELLVRAPIWADNIQVAEATGAIRELTPENRYLKLTDACQANERFTVTFSAAPRIEGRRFQGIRPKPGQISRLDDVSLVLGPHLLCAPLDGGKGRMALLASIDEHGRIELLRDGKGKYADVELPDGQAVASADRVALLPMSEALGRRWSRLAFAHDLVVVPRLEYSFASGIGLRQPETVPFSINGLPKQAVVGFPLGYYYLHGADEDTCRKIMKFALDKATEQ